MTDTSTLREAANVPQTVSAIRIALDTSNQQIDSAQQYVTIEDCLAYGKRILDAQTAQPNLQLCAQKVEGDAPDQTEVSPGPDATPTDNTALVEENIQLRSALRSIAHTFTENSHGDMQLLPAHEYQAIARKALTTAALASREAKPGPDAVEDAAIQCAAKILAMQARDTGMSTDRWYVPQVQWIKDHPGQVTDGRIGRPTLTLCPVSWLPKRLGEAVLAALTQGSRP